MSPVERSTRIGMLKNEIRQLWVENASLNNSEIENKKREILDIYGEIADELYPGIEEAY